MGIPINCCKLLLLLLVEGKIPGMGALTSKVGYLSSHFRSSANHSVWSLSGSQCKTPLFFAVKGSFRVVLVQKFSKMLSCLFYSDIYSQA